MDDKRIVSLFWARDEEAIAASSAKYGRYCEQIALNILQNIQDAEECVNDTWLKAWGAIPPQRPTRLGAFLGKITRHLALDRYKARHTAKRGDGEFLLSLEELGDCIPDKRENNETDGAVIGACINAFLKTEPAMARKIFVCRYFYNDSIEAICRRFSVSESRVKSSLFRTRNRLREYLTKEGISI